jgi:hypothetical protein
MEEIEEDILGFLHSRTSEYLFLVGDIGIGKSSIISYLFRRDKPVIQDSIVFFINVNARDVSLKLPIGYSTKAPSEQCEIAFEEANKFLHKYILSRINTTFKLRDNKEYIFDICEKENPEFIIENNAYTKMDLDIVLDKFRVEYPEAHTRVCLKALLRKMGYKHVIVIIDNCDQKDSFLIEGFVERLGSFAECVRNLNTNVDEEDQVCFTPIISCRPSTYWNLRYNSERNSVGIFGEKKIQIETPCAVSHIIEHRYKKEKFSSRINENELRSKNGIIWNSKRLESFLLRFCHRLKNDGHGEFIATLCNNDIASALRATVDVISNKPFINLDRILAEELSKGRTPNDIQDYINQEKEATQAGIPRSAVIRALAMGSPTGIPYYPIVDTKISNVLHSRVTPFGKTCIGLWLLKFLATREPVSTFGIEFTEVVNTFHNLLEFDNELTRNGLMQMLKQGLITTNRGKKFPPIDEDELIIITPKGNLHWEILAKNSVLLECLRDDLPLPSHFGNRNKLRFGRIDEFELYKELIMICDEYWRCECKEMDRISRDGKYDDLLYFIGDGVITRHLMRGVENSYNLYFKSRFSDDQCEEVTNHFGNLNFSILAWTRLWKAYYWFSKENYDKSLGIANKIIEKYHDPLIDYDTRVINNTYELIKNIEELLAS